MSIQFGGVEGLYTGGPLYVSYLDGGDPGADGGVPMAPPGNDPWAGAAGAGGPAAGDPTGGLVFADPIAPAPNDPGYDPFASLGPPTYGPEGLWDPTTGKGFYVPAEDVLLVEQRLADQGLQVGNNGDSITASSTGAHEVEDVAASLNLGSNAIDESSREPSSLADFSSLGSGHAAFGAGPSSFTIDAPPPGWLMPWNPAIGFTMDQYGNSLSSPTDQAIQTYQRMYNAGEFGDGMPAMRINPDGSVSPLLDPGGNPVLIDDYVPGSDVPPTGGNTSSWGGPVTLNGGFFEQIADHGRRGIGLIDLTQYEGRSADAFGGVGHTLSTHVGKSDALAYTDGRKH